MDDQGQASQQPWGLCNEVPAYIWILTAADIRIDIQGCKGFLNKLFLYKVYGILSHLELLWRNRRG